MARRTPILACVTLALTLGAASFEPPQITINDPRILYTMALYKSALGETDSALRLMQRAEQSKQKAEPALQQIHSEHVQNGGRVNPGRS